MIQCTNGINVQNLSHQLVMRNVLGKLKQPEGSRRGGPNPISQETVFFQIPAQIPQSQPVLLKLKSHSHFSIVFFFFMNPSPSAQNPISQPLKMANPSSHFIPSRRSTWKEKYFEWKIMPFASLQFTFWTAQVVCLGQWRCWRLIRGHKIYQRDNSRIKRNCTSPSRKDIYET